MKKLVLICALLCAFGIRAAAQDKDFEVDPQFPGGMEALVMYVCMNVEYPETARSEGIEGKVYVSFVIDKDGSITDIKLLRDIGGGCGEAVVKMLRSMPRWKPGMAGGKPVRVQFNLPVNFSLRDEESSLSKEEECRLQAKLMREGQLED